MKKCKAWMIIGVLLVITGIAAAAHLGTRQEVPEGAIEVVAGEEYAECHVDDEALYQMILDTFYIKE